MFSDKQKFEKICKEQNWMKEMLKEFVEKKENGPRHKERNRNE